jgi:hypothetical protein
MEQIGCSCPVLLQKLMWDRSVLASWSRIFPVLEHAKDLIRLCPVLEQEMSSLVITADVLPWKRKYPDMWKREDILFRRGNSFCGGE